MINLDELKRELYEKAWYIDGGMTNRELCVNFDTALAVIERHLNPQQPSPDRAALVERMAEAIRETPVEPCDGGPLCDEWPFCPHFGPRMAEAALAALPERYRRIVLGGER